MVVVLDPQPDPFPRFLERLETSPHQELVLERLPEPLDLPQRHGMMRGTTDVVNVIPLEFLLELRGATPTGVLPPVVREHLLGRTIRRHRLAVDLHHIGAGLAAVHPQSGDIPRIIIDEPDDVRRLAQDGEVRDITLPHLVGRRALEPPGGHLRFPAGFRLGRPQPRLLQVLAHRLRTGFEAEEPLQHLRDPPRPMFRLRLLQFRDLLVNRCRQLRTPPSTGSSFLQPLLTVFLVALGPRVNRRIRDPKVPADQLRVDPFLEIQLHRPATNFIGIRRMPAKPARTSRHTGNGLLFTRLREPPRGLLLPLLLPARSSLPIPCHTLRIHW